MFSSDTPLSYTVHMLICDTHCDTLFTRVTEEKRHPDVTLERLKTAGVSLQVLALFAGFEAKPNKALALNEAMRREFTRLQKEEGWHQINALTDLKEREPNFLLSLEGGEVLASGLSALEEQYAFGVRMASLTWNRENRLATSHNVNQHDGLKPFGLSVVKRMQALKIMVDLSHLNDAGIDDILKKTDVPPLVSHTACRALFPASRNMSDRHLKALFRCGGFVGVFFLPYFLTDGEATVSHVVDQIDHLMDLGGEGKVGIGSDFDGMSKSIEGLTNPTDLVNLFTALKERGYSKPEIESIAGEAFFHYAKRISNN